MDKTSRALIALLEIIIMATGIIVAAEIFAFNYIVTNIIKYSGIALITLSTVLTSLVIIQSNLWKIKRIFLLKN
jgi:hypothetical protein